MVAYKNCPTCLKDVEISDFTKNKSKPNGLGYRCKSCQRLYTKAHYRQNKNYYGKKARLWEASHPNAKRLSSIKSRHLARFIEPFDLTTDWFEDLLKKPCPVSGVTFSTEYGHDFYPEVDRINNHKGYTQENCRLVCHFYNEFKSDKTDAVALSLMQLCVDYKLT